MECSSSFQWKEAGISERRLSAQVDREKKDLFRDLATNSQEEGSVKQYGGSKLIEKSDKVYSQCLKIILACLLPNIIWF